MKTGVNRDVIITCALTGAGDTVGRSEHVPVTPQQIAEAGIAAARAGAAIVHVHVRDPQTGQGSREVSLYREVVERIRDSGVDVVINTTAGMGGDLVLDPDDPTRFLEGTDLVSGVERLVHVAELLPDICTLDCGSLNFGEGSLVYVSTPDMLRAGARRIQELGVRCEMEIFDTGHLWFARQLVEEGLIDAPAMFQLCMDIPYGAPADPALLMAMVAQLPEGAQWASFALGRMQLPWAAQSVLLGGHVRVGLEDNLYLSRGRQGDQRAAGRAGRDPGRGARLAGGHTGRGAAAPRPEAAGLTAMTASAPVPGRVGPADVRAVTCVGAGVIGGGWAAYFLARGLAVTAWDPAPDAEARLHKVVDLAWPALVELGLAPGASRDRLTFEPDLARACAGADFVQESAPEDLDLKVRLLADLDAVTPPHVVIASSTSGYPMSDLQVGCVHPERLVVGHPFNPPYLIPLVEVVGGARTCCGRRGLGGGVLHRLRQDRRRDGPRGARVHRQPAAGGAVAGGPAHDRRRRGDRRADRPLDRRRPRAALADPRPDADLPPGRRSGRDGAHARPLRPVAALALDAADGPRADGRAP